MFHLFLGLFAISASLLSLLLYIFLMLLPPTALALLALWKRALTVPGLLLAWALAVVITFAGGLPGFAVLAATFILTIAAGKLSGKTGAAVGAALHAKTGRRDAVQIACNVLVGALMLLLHAVTGAPCFLWAYTGAMAASLADSMASELGVRARRAPRDILTLRPVERGLSGGVTLCGLGASLLGAALIAALGALCWGGGLPMFLGVTAAGFLAALADSVLGSALQAKYRCPRCGALTEQPGHCGVPGTLAHGCRRITNDAVNFCNNLLGAAAALALYFAAR